MTRCEGYVEGKDVVMVDEDGKRLGQLQVLHPSRGCKRKHDLKCKQTSHGHLAEEPSHYLGKQASRRRHLARVGGRWDSCAQ